MESRQELIAALITPVRNPDQIWNYVRDLKEEDYNCKGIYLLFTFSNWKEECYPVFSSSFPLEEMDAIDRNASERKCIDVFGSVSERKDNDFKPTSQRLFVTFLESDGKTTSVDFDWSEESEGC